MRPYGIPFRATVCLFVLMGCIPAGPVLATLSLESSFSVTGTFLDNLFYTAQNKKSDFGALFGPNLSLQYKDADVVLGAAYQGRLGVFVNNPGANRTLHNINLIVDLPFLNRLYNGVKVDIDESMQFTPQLDAFSGSGAQTVFPGFRTSGASGTRPPKEGVPSLWEGGSQGVFTRRANAFLNRAALTVSYAWTRRVQVSVGYRNQYRQFSSNAFQDSLTHIGTFSFPYRVRGGTTVTPSYSYRETQFIGGSTSTTSADKLISHNTQLGVFHALTSSLQGSLSGGIALTKQVGAQESVAGVPMAQRSISNQWRTNFVGSAGFTKTYRNGSLNIRASQGIGGGGGLASQATRTRTVTGSISHAFTRRLTGFGSVGYARNQSNGGNAINTKTYRIQTGLNYDFLRWLSGNLSYSHIQQQSSGIAATALTVNQVFFGLTAFADPWIPIP